MRNLFLMLTGAYACVFSFAQDYSADGKAKVYRGPNGATLTLVTLKPKLQKRVLIAYEGTDGAWDGKVIETSYADRGRDAEYVTQWEGSSFYAIRVRSIDATGGTWEAFWPGKITPHRLTYDEKLSATANAEEVINKWLGRKPASAKGTANAFDREDEIAKEEKNFNTALASMNSTCQTKINGRVDWKTMKDEALKKSYVGAFCAAVCNAIEKLCDDEVGREVIGQKIGNIECVLGNKLGIKLNGKTLVWTTAVDNANQDDFAKNFLGKNL